MPAHAKYPSHYHQRKDKTRATANPVRGVPRRHAFLAHSSRPAVQRWPTSSCRAVITPSQVIQNQHQAAAVAQETVSSAHNKMR